MALTRRSAWIRRFFAWMNERFPPALLVINFIVFITILYFARLMRGTDAVEWDMFGDTLGFFAFYSVPFMLRVFDEHKDYAIDMHNHPDRVLQRGLITLKDLRIVCVIAIVYQLVASAVLDQEFGSITNIWVLVLLYSLLMAIEFFCGEWLEQHIFVYAFSHQLISPLIVYWVVCMGAKKGFMGLGDIGWLLVLSFFAGFAYEISRKMKTPEQERNTIDTYTKAFGTTVAPWMALILLLLTSLVMLALLEQLGEKSPISDWWSYGVIGLFVLMAIPFVQFSAEPRIELVKRMEAAAGMVLIVNHLILFGAVTKVATAIEVAKVAGGS